MISQYVVQETKDRAVIGRSSPRRRFQLAKPNQGLIFSKYPKTTVQYGCDTSEVSPISLDSPVRGLTESQPYVLSLGYHGSSDMSAGV